MEVIATPCAPEGRAGGARIVGVGTRLSVVMSSHLFSCEKMLFLALFLMRMVRHLGFTAETMVYHGPHGRPSHITAEHSHLPRWNEVTRRKNIYYE